MSAKGGGLEQTAPSAGALTVAVTRPLPAGKELARRLEERGFRALLCPTLVIAPAPDPGALRAAAARCAGGAYHWTVFTSANAVRALASALAELGSGEGPPRSRVAVVGRATAAEVVARGWTVDRIPARATAEGLLAEFERDLSGVRVLMPAAEAAREVLPVGLRERGAEVELVVAYRSLTPPAVSALREEIRAGRVHALTFASPSSASNLCEVAGEDALTLPAIAIGPVTAAAAERLGFRVVAVADEQSTEGLVAAVAAWAAELGGQGPGGDRARRP